MKPAFAILSHNYPRYKFFKRKELLASIGWSDVLNNPAFLDSCAIRMSITLVGSGVILPGARMKINAGPQKDRWIEPGQARLSNILKRLWGDPEVFKGEAAARAGIGDRRGVVSFWRIHGGPPTDQGHIDLVWPGVNGFSQCATGCYFSAAEVWFWSLT